MATSKDIDPRGFLLNDNDTGVDHLGESTFADAIAESIHHVETPITIGLFAKWGSGKSFLLRHVESLLKRYQKQQEITAENSKGPPDHNLRWKHKYRGCKWAIFVIIAFAIILGTLILAVKPLFVTNLLHIKIENSTLTNSTATTNTVTASNVSSTQEPAILRNLKIIGLVLLPLEILMVFLITCFGNSWFSPSYYGSCRILTYGAFTKLPIRNPRSNIVEDPGESPAHILKHIRPGDERLAMAASEVQIFPRKYIFVDFKAWEYAGSDTLWAAIVTNITDAIEEEFGMVTARMFRMIEIEQTPSNICSTDARTIYVSLAHKSLENEVRDLMKQYGVVKTCKQLGALGDNSRRYWQVEFCSDGECRCAKDCLRIEGVPYLETDPRSPSGNEYDNNNFNRKQPARESQKRLIEMQNLKGVDEKSIEDLDRWTSPPDAFCCNRFCVHFLRFPTKIQCLPRLVWWILIIICTVFIPIIAYIIAEYLNLDIYRTFRIVPIAGQILLWLPAGLAVSVFAIKFVWAMCHSQRKRINAALDGTRNNMANELGFMNKVKSEIAVVSRLIQCARFILQKDYKIVITIDDLDRVSLNKVHAVLEAVNILLSDKSAPFICLVAVDSRVVVKCIEESMGEVLRQSNITGHEYLKKIINLPICLPEINDSNKKRFIAGLIDQADLTVTYRQREEKEKQRSPLKRAEQNGRLHFTRAQPKREREEQVDAKDHHNFKADVHRERTSAIVTEVDHVATDGNLNIKRLSCPVMPSHDENYSRLRKPNRKDIGPKIELGHKKFLFHCRRYIYENEQLHKHMQGNPRSIKRLFNVISLTASIIDSFFKKQRRRQFIRSHAEDEQERHWEQESVDTIVRTKELAEDVVQWIILTDQWPYRTSYIIQVIEDADQREAAKLVWEKIPEDWTIYEIYQEKVKDECSKGDDWLLSLDGDPDLFFSYLRILKDYDFTAQKIRNLLNYTVNLDLSIRHAIAFTRDLSGLTTLGRPENTTTPEESSRLVIPDVNQNGNKDGMPMLELDKALQELQHLTVPSDHRPYSWHDNYQLHQA